jgi:hypothetical protein
MEHRLRGHRSRTPARNMTVVRSFFQQQSFLPNKD